MALLDKWIPSRELQRLRQEFDDLFEQGSLFKEWQPTIMRPAIESYVDGDNFTVRVELPGVDPKGVEVKVAGKKSSCGARSIP
jgi:HSP20 family molecular chaperone IbpA